MYSDHLGDLIRKTKTQDFRALARLLTLLERDGATCLEQYPELGSPSTRAFRIGITGPPGAGKSTLIGQLLAEFRKRNLSVGIMAIDPSSPFTKGAVLGDRIRYTEFFGDPKVFIRSLGSRGSLGGLSSSAYLMARAFDLANFDVVLIETVGVGQTELEIMNVADFVAVVLVPESGDSIQGMKAGLLEIANLFIVNKADRPGAESFARELEASIHLDANLNARTSEVLLTSALQSLGISQLCDRFLDEKSKPQWRDSRQSLQRLKAEASALIRNRLEGQIAMLVEQIKSPSDFVTAIQDRLELKHRNS